MFTPDDPLAPSGPVFDEPWQAQVLALADSLIKGGNFSAKNWAQTLGAALKDADARGAPDNTETYYLCAVEALANVT
ncbi:MAG: nitrile hydratase accessory protein [Paracoccaceae bacterium]